MGPKTLFKIIKAPTVYPRNPKKDGSVLPFAVTPSRVSAPADEDSSPRHDVFGYVSVYVLVARIL